MKRPSPNKLAEVIRQIDAVRNSLDRIEPDSHSSSLVEKFVSESGILIEQLQSARSRMSPVKLGPIGISLGRSDSIAKFFAFSFVSQEMHRMTDLFHSPFFGSGVYAVYYHGMREKTYRPLSGTETPIYVGKADPKDAYAETVEAQEKALFLRLREHARNIQKTNLDLSEFRYRSAAIQTGMQAAVEEFMIRLFRPIWNKEIKICFGIGKHGDSATTRANKRSPWDTMHPGRKWAVKTKEDQTVRVIEKKIADHFEAHPIIKNKEVLFQKLALR